MMKLTRKAVALAGAAAMMASCNHMKQIKHMPYPETQRTDVVDDYFGTKVADPYRWLEDDNSEATAAWVKAQNAVTQDYLSQIPFRDAIRGRLTQLWNYPKEGIPAKHGDAWYYFYNDGLQNQSVLYRTAQPGGEGEVFIDPNTLSEDGTVALSGVTFSKDGKYCAYSVAASGSDWVEIRVMNTADRTLTSDRINWVKFSGAEWAPDSKGFYYSAYDAPQKGVFSSQNQFQKVFRYDLLAGYSAEDEAEEQALFDQLESDPDIKEWMPQYRAAITAVDERHSYEVNLTVSQDYTRLTDFISLQERVSRRVLTPEKEGAIITEKLGTMLGLKAGDTLTLRDGDNRTYELAIAGVSENYASHFVYISAEYYEEVFGKALEYNTVIVDLVDRDDWAAASEKLLAGGTVQMISSDAELVEQYKNVTDNLGYVVAVLIVSAGLLAFVVQYNLSNINITERTREIATLKVLGFYDGEVSAYIYRESVILTILGTGLGLLLGTALTRFVVATAEVDSIMFGRSIYWPSFLMAALITFLFSFLVNWVMHYRLKKINMVESMKSVD